MNQLGMHMFIYTPRWAEEDARLVFTKAKEFGYDLAEVLLLDVDSVDTAMTARLARELDMGVAVTMTGTLAADLSSADPDVVRRGEDLIMRGIVTASQMGATFLGGPTFSAVHRYAEPPAPDALERAVEIYGRVARRAGDHGMRVGLEALNRYESRFVNTLEQAATIVRAAGPEELFVHADLFHMMIEEPNLYESVHSVADVLGYVHVAESNRGPLGTGNTPWRQLFDALAESNYSGPITFETFSPSVLGPEIASLIALWREPWSDPDTVAHDGIEFLRRHLAEAAARREGK